MGNFGVIICAGGTGERFGGKKKKPFVDVAGRTAFLRSVDFFAERDDVTHGFLGLFSHSPRAIVAALLLPGRRRTVRTAFAVLDNSLGGVIGFGPS